MKLTEQEYRRRIAEFPEPIRVLGYDIPLVKHIMDTYAHGQIITMQEALCQMIVGLAINGESHRNQLMKLAVLGTFSPTITEPPLNPLAHEQSK